MHSLHLALFDIAGTTLLDNNLVDNAFLAVFEQHGIHAEPEELLPFRGSAKRPIVDYVVKHYRPDAGLELVDEMLEGFEAGLEAVLRRGAEPIPGTNETFAWLREHGIRVGLTTGFSARTKDVVLELFNWTSDIVQVAVCSTDVPESRPAPWMIYRAMEQAGVQNAAQVMTVGDTPRDLQAGTRAGCGAVVGVLSGSHDAASLGRHRHTHLLASVAEIPELIEREYIWD